VEDVYMSEREVESSRVLRLIDAIGQLFRLREGVDDHALEMGAFARTEREFDSVLAALRGRMEERRPPGWCRDLQCATAEHLAEEKMRRKIVAHGAMREDIEQMHVRLRTGLRRADLNDIIAFLKGLDAFAGAGRDSHALLPRVRHGITQRLRAEAGAMALDRLHVRLKRQGLRWPDPPRYQPHATREDIELSRLRRMSDVRVAFVAYRLERIADRAQGVVWGWGGDYPDRESVLWRESVLVGVAAALCGQLLQHFLELLRQDGDLLLARIEESVGERLPTLRALLDSGAFLVPEAQQVISRSLRVLDEGIPEVAWQLVYARLPRSPVRSAARAESRHHEHSPTSAVSCP
jgi:hypothetical protein